MNKKSFKCNIGSLNVRGLGNKLKRKVLFNYFKDKNLDIIFIQESHCTAKNKHLFEAEWGTKWYAEAGTTASCGVAILRNPKSNISIKNCLYDKHGRYVICDMKVENCEYTLVNVYAPNVDEPNFFVSLFNDISLRPVENLIIGGDFNLVLDVRLDRYNSVYNNHKSLEVIKEYIEELDLCDVWRIANPECRRYSWYKRKPELSASRIDFFLTNIGLADQITHVDYCTSNRTDHSLNVMTLENTDFKRGPGIWKFNATLLLDEDYCDLAKKEIRETIDACTRDRLNKIDKWECIKKNCTRITQKYAKKKKKKSNNLLTNLYEYRDTLLNNELTTGHIIVTDELEKQIVDKINEIEEQKVKSSVFRSKCKWAKYGERPNKYFFALEKRNYANKTMFAVQLADGSVCRNQSRILAEQAKFYQTLYSMNCDIQFDIKNETNVRLSEAQKLSLDEDISLQEISDSLNDMKLGKVPGCDGLTVEFYRHFFDDLKIPLYEMYVDILSAGIMTNSMRRGLISLLPKRNKNILKINGYRLLTLLSNDYKILAKLFANRMKKVLPDIIGEQQSGFMAGRKIHTNIRRTMDIVSYLNKTDTRAVIVSIDFEKCFDRIEHNSLFGAMKYFNFGEKFINAVKIFFNQFMVCTQNAGFTSELFHKTRGVNQGCPISPFLYNLIGEILAHRIKGNPRIQGIKMGLSKNAVSEVITQFADDTGLFLLYNETTLNEAIRELAHIENNTGLKISYDKTKVYRVGSLKGSGAHMYTLKQLQWSDDNIEMLGVTISNDNCQSSVQFNSILKKMKEVCNKWYNRQLTLMGKVLLINTLIGSLFVYSLTVLPLITVAQNKEIEKIICEFLWKGKRNKIPLEVLYRNKEEGGLKLVNVRDRQRSLRVGWIREVYGKKEWQYIYQWLVPCLGEMIWECNLHKADVRKICLGEPTNFWVETLEIWSELHYCEPQNREEICDQIIWGNSLLKVDGKILTPLKGLAHKVIRFSDILRDDCCILSWEEFRHKFGISCRSDLWLYYCGMVKAIPKYWKVVLDSNAMLSGYGNLELKRVIESKTPTRNVYNWINKNRKSDKIAEYCTKWYAKLDVNDQGLYDYFKLLKLTYSLTPIVKLKDFQYRLLIAKIFTNDTLAKWKIVNSEICNLCKKERQTNVHLLVYCEHSARIWETLQMWFPEGEFTRKNIMCNTVHEVNNNILNLMTLIIKQYIFRCKCMDIVPTLKTSIIEIKLQFEIERNNENEHKTMRKWGPVLNNQNIEFE